MGLLDQMWDDTMAGPRPESGLGRLRKDAPSPAASRAIDVPRVSRSIMVIRTPMSSGASSPRGSGGAGSVPSSPVSAPDSPLFGPSTPRAEWSKVKKKARPVADGMEPAVEPRSPTVYDWVVISSLDR